MPVSATSPQPSDEWDDIGQQVRLLGDTVRTQGLVDFLSRHAPGRTVLEIGCGTGLLSCIAARMGAKQVIALEPSARVQDAVRLVEDSGLSDIVEVICAPVEDLAPRPMDLVFSELLNADPFVEGVLSAMDAGARWLAPGGILAPYRLDLYVALIAAADVDAEQESARDIVGRLGKTWDLAVEPLLASFRQAPRPRYTASFVELRSAPVLAWSGPLGTGARPPHSVRVKLMPTIRGPIRGATLWFSSPYDDGLVLANPPEDPGHWGIHVTGWPTGVRAEVGQPIEVEVLLDPSGVEIRPA